MISPRLAFLTLKARDLYRSMLIKVPRNIERQIVSASGFPYTRLIHYLKHSDFGTCSIELIQLATQLLFEFILKKKGGKMWLMAELIPGARRPVIRTFTCNLLKLTACPTCHVRWHIARLRPVPSDFSSRGVARVYRVSNCGTLHPDRLRYSCLEAITHRRASVYDASVCERFSGTLLLLTPRYAISDIRLIETIWVQL